MEEPKSGDHGKQQADHRTEDSEDAGEDELILGVPGVIQESGSREGQEMHDVPRGRTGVREPTGKAGVMRPERRQGVATPLFPRKKGGSLSGPPDRGDRI